jgi:hypothetical protein
MRPTRRDLEAGVRNPASDDQERIRGVARLERAFHGLMLFRMGTSTNPPLAVRGSAAVCRELNVATWFLERVLREEAITVQRIGNARAWTDADVERLRHALAARAARNAARRRSTSADTVQA